MEVRLYLKATVAVVVLMILLVDVKGRGGRCNLQEGLEEI